MSEFINQLNQAQKQAVINYKGPSLVIAGAGSGKTRVLIYRIAYLLQNGVKPWRILALTFTNKAAKEMKERIAALIGEEHVRSLWMGTFHSIFAKFLRKEADALGYPSSFTIYDTVDTKSILRAIIKELKLDDKEYKVNTVYSKISGAKNDLITASAYENNSHFRIEDEKSRKPELYRIYKIYAERCFRAGAMDFDDLLLKTNILFRDRPDILEKYQNKFDYILVDEYQDTNFSQYLIVKKLAEQHKNICVVGDDAQSIYSFRGAKIENILKFQKEYKNHKLFKLEQNYRSTKNIVDAANSVIEKNKNRIKKVVFSKKEDGDKIKIIEALTDNEEGFVVINKISESVITDETKYLNHAILYRTNAQSRIFEEALRKRNIPYKIYGGTSFYQRKEIKDLLAYFKLTVNKQDDESLKRIINYPKRGIGKTSIDRLEGFARENDISMWEAMMKIKSVSIGLNSRAVSQMLLFAEMINYFTDELKEKDAYCLGKEIAEKSGILKELFADKSPELIARHENVQELLNGIKEFTGDAEDNDEGKLLDNYLESVALLTNEDNEKEEDKNKVTLMTIHSSKGLEFRNVYIVGVEERLFPSEMSSYSPKEIEEERRLFYVAVTRAEKELVISYSRQRYRWGKLNDCTPSRFIKDIDAKYVDFHSGYDNDSGDNNSFTVERKKYSSFSSGNKFAKKSFVPNSNKNEITTASVKNTNYNRKLKKIDNNTEGTVADNGKINKGTKVKHSRFGIGEVISVEGAFPNTKVVIEFTSAGKKSLLIKFAKLEVLK
ncbi:MAG: exodeoxyribonuclease V subunit gamma [Bacteroidales bacterium]|nr:exodeoxyribonuclease V subunit gamma [Bacteroidales bacterium]